MSITPIGGFFFTARTNACTRFTVSLDMVLPKETSSADDPNRVIVGSAVMHEWFDLHTSVFQRAPRGCQHLCCTCPIAMYAERVDGHRNNSAIDAFHRLVPHKSHGSRGRSIDVFDQAERLVPRLQRSI